MTVRSRAMTSVDHYRAAQVLLELHGPQAEAEVLSHLTRMHDCDDAAGVQIWLGVLAALKDLQRIRQASSLLH
jgi:uncharacterized protein YceH (UPF0502 family)